MKGDYDSFPPCYFFRELWPSLFTLSHELLLMDAGVVIQLHLKCATTRAFHWTLSGFVVAMAEKENGLSDGNQSSSEQEKREKSWASVVQDFSRQSWWMEHQISSKKVPSPVFVRAGGKEEILGQGHSGFVEAITMNEALNLEKGGVSKVLHESSWALEGKDGGILKAIEEEICSCLKPQLTSSLEWVTKEFKI